MFIVEFTDGNKFSSLDGNWANLPDKDIKKLTVLDSSLRMYTLEGYDVYLYAKEAISSTYYGDFDVAIWAGGFYEPNGDGNIIKVVLNDLVCQSNDLAPIPSDCKDFYPVNMKETGFAGSAFKRNKEKILDKR